MALLLPPNCAVDIWRGYSPANPARPPSYAPAARAVPGFLKHHVRNGRFGFRLVALHWTTVLLLDPGVDIRSAYDSQLNAWDPTRADSVLIADTPVPGRCSPHLVVLVTRVDAGLPSEHLRCYLDRGLPLDGKCPSGFVPWRKLRKWRRPRRKGDGGPGPGGSDGKQGSQWGGPPIFNGGTVSGSCCPGTPIPMTLYASFSNKTGTCTCIADAVTLTWNPAAAAWQGSAPNDSTCPGIPGGNTLYVSFGCVGGVWFLRARCTPNPPLSFSGTNLSCSPLHVQCGVSLGNPSNCCAGEAQCDVTQ